MIKKILRDQRGAVTASITLRRDAWWVEALPTIVLLGGFTLYAFYVIFTNAHYYVEPYLSPFYSPCLASNCAHQTLPLVGTWWTLSPALLVLWAPLGFRATCYYYRKAYYRAFFLSPPACAVHDLPVAKGYTGETRLPWVLQNVHRYFFWIALPVLAFLWWDALLAFRFPDGVGIGVGTLVMVTNIVLLSAYTFSCHSCRHLCGGAVNVFSKAPVRSRLWRFVSRLNERHGPIAWVSMVSVALTDVYIRLVSLGMIHDVRLL
ncbi:MAG TPA: succinate dehydrogenase [bacterium]|jgi:hypothetical protein|nr:succinate dehydrogenase [bacterium]